MAPAAAHPPPSTAHRVMLLWQRMGRSWTVPNWMLSEGGAAWSPSRWRGIGCPSSVCLTCSQARAGEEERGQWEACDEDRAAAVPGFQLVQPRSARPGAGPAAAAAHACSSTRLHGGGRVWELGPRRHGGAVGARQQRHLLDEAKGGEHHVQQVQADGLAQAGLQCRRAQAAGGQRGVPGPSCRRAGGGRAAAHLHSHPPSAAVAPATARRGIPAPALAPALGSRTGMFLTSACSTGEGVSLKLVVTLVSWLRPLRGAQEQGSSEEGVGGRQARRPERAGQAQAAPASRRSCWGRPACAPCPAACPGEPLLARIAPRAGPART